MNMNGSSSEKMASSSGEDWEKDLDWLIKDSDKKEKSGSSSSSSNSSSSSEDEAETTKKPAKEPVKEKYATPQERALSPVKSESDDEPRTDVTTDEEDNEDGLTSKTRPIVQRNTQLNNAEDSEDYDVQARLEKANAELAGGDSSDEADRERKVLFKPKLIDFEAPPDDYSSSSSDEEEDLKKVSKTVGKMSVNGGGGDSRSYEEEEIVEINGQFVRKDEKILIERGGKFELVEASELKGILPPVSNGNGSNGHSVAVVVEGKSPDQSALPPVKGRPKSAPVRSHKPRPPPSTRPVSATEQQTYRRRSERTFSYSPEMKKILKKQLEAKAAREREDNRRRKAEEQETREFAEDAWKAWVERKNKSIKEERDRKREEERKREAENRKDPNEADEAYKDWLKHKSVQIKQERLATQQLQIEHDEGWFLRERKECNKAYRQWLRKKNEDARKQKDLEKSLRRQSRREARQVRRAQKLLDSIRETQQMKYVEYYGYRF